MKKLFLYLGVMALLIAGAGDLLAGSIDYRSNQSADYIRSYSRNAATDAADCAYYNPAGMAKLADGLFINAGNQFVFKNYSAEAGGETYESTEPTLLLPNLYGIYKTGSLAVSLAFTIPAGGGTVKFADGLPMLAAVGGKDIEVTQIYYGYALGIAYAVTDMISLSAGARYVQATKKIAASTSLGDVDVEQTASGWAPIFSINIAPAEKINIGIKYEMKTELEFENSTSKSVLGMFPDGEKERKDLPALLALGIGYNISPEIVASFSLNYYFITQADQGEDDAYNDEYTNGYDAAVAIEYAVTPKELIVSVGYNYSKIGGSEDTYSDFDFALDSNSICAGAKYSVNPELDLTLGLSGTFYTEGENAAGTTKYNKTAYTVAIGANYKAM